jgi:hypothetical protein
MSTVPRTPVTMRTSTGGSSSSRGGMKSVTRTAPSGVSQSVSRISVSPAYRRVAVAARRTGAICHWPWLSVPSRAAKHASESKRGRHSQSTEPSVLISATDCMSPTMA